MKKISCTDQRFFLFQWIKLFLYNVRIFLLTTVLVTSNKCITHQLFAPIFVQYILWHLTSQYHFSCKLLFFLSFFSFFVIAAPLAAQHLSISSAQSTHVINPALPIKKNIVYTNILKLYSKASEPRVNAKF